MPDDSSIPPEWLAERWKYAFIKTYKPVMDHEPSRSCPDNLWR